MATKSWRKIENEAGYPCYIEQSTGVQQNDHPEYQQIMKSLENYDNIKYSAYRIAFKIYALQKQLQVPCLRISSGVFARHQLSLSESSLSIDTAELEAVLADIYFAAQKEGVFTGDVDLAVDLLLNLLLNVYDGQRKEPIKVLAAKTLLIVLSDECAIDKWLALANCSADHNGCVSARRLAALLNNVTALPHYLGEKYDRLQADIDDCFSKSAGMLGVSANSVAEWGAARCFSASWLAASQRLAASRTASPTDHSCSACESPLNQVLKFKCSNCSNLHLCENCYLFDKDIIYSIAGHKKTHTVQEIVNGEIHNSQCLAFIRGIRFLFCKKSKKKSKKIKNSVKNDDSENKRKEGRPTVFTSTVSKATSNANGNPVSVLQDIINNLEKQNKALQDLSNKLQNVDKNNDDGIKDTVEVHWDQISKQINRLKILKENLLMTPQSDGAEKCKQPQMFDLFSPIQPLDKKQSKVVDDKVQPAAVSYVDSGNFSVTSKHKDSHNLMTLSGDALKPVVVNATSDSISTVSMNDISTWYNESEEKRRVESCRSRSGCGERSLSATEQRYAADIRTVQTKNDHMKELNADLDTVLDRLQQILTHNFAMDDSCFDNTQLRETANEMEGLLGTLIRGVEQRATLNKQT